MEDKGLRRVCFYFNSSVDDDYFQIVEEVDVKELMFNITNGTKQRFIVFEPREGSERTTIVINLDNVTCIVMDA